MDVFTSRSCHAFGSCDSCASRRLASARVERCSLLSSYHRHISSLRRATTSIRRPHSLHRSSPLRRREWARADKGGTAALCPAPRRDGCLCALSSGPVCRKTCWIGVPLKRPLRGVHRPPVTSLQRSRPRKESHGGAALSTAHHVPVVRGVTALPRPRSWRTRKGHKSGRRDGESAKRVWSTCALFAS